jgi:Ca2+-binding RTX toxin-like protein
MTTIRVAAVAVALAVSGVLAPAAGATILVGISSTKGLDIRVSTTESRLNVATADSGTKLVVTELDNRVLTPEGACTEALLSNGTKVICPLPQVRFVSFVSFAPPGRARLRLTAGVGDCLCAGGSGDDTLIGADGADLMEGGAGNDVLEGGDGGDELRGEDGFDTLTGGPGNDTAEGGGGSDVFTMGAVPDGADTLRGGDGLFDNVSYAGRRSAVEASIDVVANDGAPPAPGAIFGERDNIATSVEELTGGGGNDVLRGSSAPNKLSGGAGNDLLNGGTPPPGESPSLDDVLDGGVGSDALQGAGGADTLFVRDAIDDQIDAVLSCGFGAGTDRLDADIRDDDTRPLPIDCETVDQGMVGEHPNVRILSASRGGRRGLEIALRCPRKTRRGCAGRLAAKAAIRRGRFGRGVRYALRRGGRAVIRVPAAAGARVRIRSLERGRLGPRTTFQTLRVGR